jgi:SAM-dependent methyltransferase
LWVGGVDLRPRTHFSKDPSLAEVIIHIGPHKTGTSALQSFLHRNADALAEQGVLYRTPGRDSINHNPLVAAFPFSTEPSNDAKSFIAGLLRDAGDGRVLISSEMLSSHQIDVAAFLRCFEGHRTKVIGYLRHPYDLIVSAYNQVVRDPTGRRKEPLAQVPLAYDPSLRTIIGRWVERNDLVLCPYDPKQWPDGSLAKDFLATIDVDPSPLSISDEQENRSLPSHFVEAIRNLNATNIDEAARAEVIDILAQTPVTPAPALVDHKLLRHCVDALRAEMPTYTPFLRPSFDTTFLFHIPDEAPVVRSRLGSMQPYRMKNGGSYVEIEGYCPVCERDVLFAASSDKVMPPQFEGQWFRGALRCSFCKSPPRERAIARTLDEARPNWRDLRIHESSPGGWAFSAKLRRECRGYVPTQYDPSFPFGEMHPSGRWRNENLEAQTFDSEAFDVVVTQDVFEHVFHPDRAIAEIARTLRPGGLCLMTVPAVRRWGPSERRAALDGGTVRHILPEQYHGNPVGDGRSLVTVDWGHDIGPYLSAHSGMSFAVLILDDMRFGIRDWVNLVLMGSKSPPPGLDGPPVAPPVGPPS